MQPACPAQTGSGGRLRLPSGLAFHSTPFDFARDSTALGLRSALAQLIGRCGDSRRSGGAPYGETLRPTRLRPERRPLLKATSGDTVCGRSRRASLDLAAAHPQFRRLRRHRCTDAAERAEPASRRLYVGGPIAEGRALGQVKLLAVVGDLGALCLGPRCPSCTSSRCSHRTCRGLRLVKWCKSCASTAVLSPDDHLNERVPGGTVPAQRPATARVQ